MHLPGGCKVYTGIRSDRLGRTRPLVPAKAGTQRAKLFRIPACAEMSGECVSDFGYPLMLGASGTFFTCVTPSAMIFVS